MPKKGQDRQKTRQQEPSEKSVPKKDAGAGQRKTPSTSQQGKRTGDTGEEGQTGTGSSAM
ncbi:hypothetical protein ACFY7H_33265 [Streptomyces sp. NPDC012794]|uniref:hypothetical protein n=1 Tax=Streptomyces sp. NPDC012794 TaxID=3364850 RepID=UPI00368A16E5